MKDLKSGETVIRGMTEEEKDWMDKFCSEYYGASVSQTDEARLKDQFHNTKELAKSCTDGNNDRNRCILNLGKATNTLKFITMGVYDQNTMEALKGHDLELLLAYNAGLIKDLNDDEED